jgi:Uma2 family endonuclease
MTEQLPLTTSPLPVKLRVEDYLLLDEAGAFTDYGKIELIEGEVLYVNAQHRLHALTKLRLYHAFYEGLGAIRRPLTALTEVSIGMPDHNVPEPDIVLTAEPEGPGLLPLASVALIVEISDTSLTQDLGRKQQLYAGGGVPEYWVVDMNGKVIHQMWRPMDQTYGKRRELPFGAEIEVATIDGLSVETSTL